MVPGDHIPRRAQRPGERARSSRGGRRDVGRGRYRVQQLGTGPTVRVLDPLRGEILFTWHGAVARNLLASDALPCPRTLDGVVPCDKRFVQRLALIAASFDLQQERADRRAADRTSDGMRSGRRPSDPLRQLDVVATPLHRRLADFLFSYPGTHFSEQEIVCAMHMDFPAVDAGAVRGHLDDLQRAELLRRIAVTETDVFYDIDVHDHLHVFCPRSRTLVDAPAAGVVVSAP